MDSIGNAGRESSGRRIALVVLNEFHAAQTSRFRMGLEIAAAVRLAEIAAGVAEAGETDDLDVGNGQGRYFDDFHAASLSGRHRPGQDGEGAKTGGNFPFF